MQIYFTLKLNFFFYGGILAFVRVYRVIIYLLKILLKFN